MLLLKPSSPPTWHPLQAAGSGAARPTSAKPSSAKPSSRPRPKLSPSPGASRSLRICVPSPWLLQLPPTPPPPTPSAYPSGSTAASPAASQAPPCSKPVPRNPCRSNQFRSGSSLQSGAGPFPACEATWPASLPASRTNATGLTALFSNVEWLQQRGLQLSRGRKSRSLHLLSPLNTPSYPFSALSNGGHTLGTPPDGRTCPCSHLCPSLGSQGPERGPQTPKTRGMRALSSSMPYYEEACGQPEAIPLRPIPR